MEEFHLKYRPDSLDLIKGHSNIISSLKTLFRSNGKTPHTFLFTGPSGVGKTTLARIVAKMVGCLPANLMEIDAATYTGVDAMRKLTEGLLYGGLGPSSVRVVILDEAQALSTPAWRSLLKSVEEPPPHAYWIFCTTEPSKIPSTIKTRSHSYELKPLTTEQIFELLVSISEKEETIDTTEEVLEIVAVESQGSARQALVYLSMVRNIEDPKEASSLLQSASLSREVVDFCRFLVKGRAIDWNSCRRFIASFKDSNSEGVRLTIVNYLSAVLMDTKTESEFSRLLLLLECFSTPYNTSEKSGPLLLSMGRYLYANK